MKTGSCIALLVFALFGSLSCADDPAEGRKLLPGKEKIAVPTPNIVTSDTASVSIPAIIDSNKKLVDEHADTGIN